MDQGSTALLATTEELSSLRMAIGSAYSSKAAERWCALRQVNWVELAALANTWGFMPLWYQAAKFRTDAPQVHLAAWRRSTLENKARNAVITHRVLKQVAALDEKGMTGILLKGAALMHQIYEQPEQRVLGDVDVWFAAAQLAEVRQALERQGFSLAEPPLVDDRLGWFNHAVAYHAQAPEAWELEIHGRLLRFPHYQHRPAFEDWLATASTLDVEGTQLRALAPEEQVLHLCAHAYYQHGHPQAHPRVAPDLGFLFKRFPTVDSARLIELARACDMTAGLHHVLTWVQKYWFVRLEPELIEALTALKPTMRERRLNRLQRGPIRKQLGWLWSLPGVLRKTRYLAALVLPNRRYMDHFWRINDRSTLVENHLRRWWFLVRGRSSPRHKRPDTASDKRADQRDG